MNFSFRLLLRHDKVFWSNGRDAEIFAVLKINWVGKGLFWHIELDFNGFFSISVPKSELLIRAHKGHEFFVEFFILLHKLW